MKNFSLLLMLLVTNITFAQKVQEANVYPSNLEENMYFEKFNQQTNTIEGLYFMVLSDGNNSEFVTPAFEFILYLLPEGSTSKDDLITVKKYSLPGIYHFGAMEYKNEKVNLNETSGIKPGNYRFGIWVNSNEAFTEDRNDNAMLFKTPIRINIETKGEEAKKTEDEWGSEEKSKQNDDNNDDDEW